MVSATSSAFLTSATELTTPATVQAATSTLKSAYNKDTHDSDLLSYRKSKPDNKGVNILNNRTE